MNKLFLVVSLVLLLCFTSILANEWSAEQKDALSSFNKYLSAARQGNLKEMVSFWHPGFVSWEYTQARPTNYDVSLKGIEAIGKSFMFKKLEFNPLEIQVEGNNAIIHGNYFVIIQDSSGKEMSTSGPETIILVKKNNRWAMIGLVSMAK